MKLEVWHFIVALFALIGPALVILGLLLGRLIEKSNSAHLRIDRLEVTLAEEFKEMKFTLRDSIEQSWKNCPLARDTHGVRRDSNT